MKYMGHELPLGISITSYEPEAVHDFVSYGFEYFEVGIPAQLPDSGDMRNIEYDYSPEVTQKIARIAGRGREEELVKQKQPLVNAIFNENLRVWSVHLPFGYGWDIAHYVESERDSVVESLKRIIDLTSDWGARVYVLHGCLEPVKPEERPVRMARSIRSLRELNEYAQRCGAHVALEDLPRSCLGNTSLEVRAMSQAAGNVHVCFDVNHLLCESHTDFMAALASRVITTHLSDYDGIDERHWLPGKGIVPWKEIALTLLKSGYRGPFLFELRKGENGLYRAQNILEAFSTALGA